MDFDNQDDNAMDEGLEPHDMQQILGPQVNDNTDEVSQGFDRDISRSKVNVAASPNQRTEHVILNGS